MVIRKIACVFFTSWFICAGLLASSSQGQEQREKVPTEIAGGFDPLVQQALEALNQRKLVDKQYFEPKSAKFQLDQVASLVELRLEYNETVTRHLRKKQAEAGAILERLADELAALEAEAVSSTGSPIPTQETLEQLSRSCMLEQQRVQWELAAEEAKSDVEAKTSARELQIQQLRLESQRLELEGFEAKLQDAMVNYEKLKQRFEQGVSPSTEIQQAELAIREIQNQFAVAQKGFEAATAELELRRERSLADGALRQKTLGVRGRVLSSQAEQLAGQHRWSASAARIKAKIAQAESELANIQQMALQFEVDRVSYEVLQDMLKRSMDAVEQEN